MLANLYTSLHMKVWFVFLSLLPPKAAFNSTFFSFPYCVPLLKQSLEGMVLRKAGWLVLDNVAFLPLNEISWKWDDHLMVVVTMQNKLTEVLPTSPHLTDSAAVNLARYS